LHQIDEFFVNVLFFIIGKMASKAVLGPQAVFWRPLN